MNSKFTSFLFASLLLVAIVKCQLAKRGKEIDSIDLLHKFWELKFAIKPWIARPGWTSLVHATGVGNKGIFGARIPGVFFKPGTTILHICGPISYPRTADCYDLNNPLELNEWRTLIIRQIPGFTENRFEISLNEIPVGLGKKAPVTQRSQQRSQQQSILYPEILLVSHRFRNYITTFQNVTVYEANPWQPQAFYQLSEYKFTSGMAEFNHFEEVKKLYPLWRMRLNVFMYKDKLSTTTNLIHVGYNKLKLNILANSYTLEVCIWAPSMVCFNKDLHWNAFSLIEVVHYPTALNARKYVVKVNEQIIKEQEYQSTDGIKEPVLVFASNPDKVPYAIIENYEMDTGMKHLFKIKDYQLRI